MRAAEFIRALADVIDALDGKSKDKEPDEKQLNPVFVPPGQQELELQKSEAGKDSPVIDKLIDDDAIGNEPQEQ